MYLYTCRSPGLVARTQTRPRAGRRIHERERPRAVGAARRAVARTALRHLLEDPIQSWVEVGPELVGEAMSAWLVRFQDQPFSLVDAVSFEVMRAEGVRSAFAFDRHFEIAGFELLR